MHDQMTEWFSVYQKIQHDIGNSPVHLKLYVRHKKNSKMKGKNMRFLSFIFIFINVSNKDNPSDWL